MEILASLPRVVLRVVECGTVPPNSVPRVVKCGTVPLGDAHLALGTTPSPATIHHIGLSAYSGGKGTVHSVHCALCSGGRLWRCGTYWDKE